MPGHPRPSSARVDLATARSTAAATRSGRSARPAHRPRPRPRRPVSASTVGPAPEITAGSPAARSAATSAAAAGIAGARYGWCSRSSVAGSSTLAARRSGAATSRAAPAGVERRVGVRDRGRQQPRGPARSTTRTAGRTRPAAIAGSRLAAHARASRRRLSVQAMVSPPSRHGATLSGWPSRSAGQRQHAGVVAALRRRRGPARGPAARRRTIAAADEPSPRPCGMRLAQCSSSPCGWPPSSVERGAASPGRPGATRRAARRSLPPLRRRCPGRSSMTRATTSS